MNFQNPPYIKDNSAGYFGKLPEYPDFVKFNAGGPEIQLLDRWIQEGIIYAKKSFNPGSQINNNFLLKDPYPINFFYPFTGTPYDLAGTIFPSHDKSGREFPFIIFMRSKKPSAQVFPNHLLHPAFNHIYKSFNEIFVKRDRENLAVVNYEISQYSHEDIYMNTSWENLFNSYNSFLENTNAEELGEKVMGDAGVPAFMKLLSNLSGGLSFLRLKPDISISFGVKISFRPFTEYNNLDSAFFLHAVLTAAGKTRQAPAVFIKHEEELTTLFIFICNPIPDHFRDLISENHKDERILDANKPLLQVPDQPGSIPDREESKLSQLINKLSFN